jgi:hypothetical protein
MMRAAISAARLPLRQPSSTITARRVLAPRRDGRVVERPQRAQVDHLGLDALAGQRLGRLQRLASEPP